jgi:hypothetical protein
MKKTLLFPSLLCIAIVAVLFVPDTNARGRICVIQPNHEVTENVNATITSTSSVSVAGKISTNSSIDFYVTNPSGAILLSYPATNDTSFDFALKENGTYQMHLVNTHSTENVTVVLTYGFNYVFTFSDVSRTEETVQFSAVTPLPPFPPPDSPDNPDQYDPYANYLNFLKASQILRDLNENLQRILPINKLPLAVIYNILVMYALGAAAMQLHRMVGRTLRIAERKKINLSLMGVK